MPHLSPAALSKVVESVAEGEDKKTDNSEEKTVSNPPVKEEVETSELKVETPELKVTTMSLLPTTIIVTVSFTTRF